MAFWNKKNAYWVLLQNKSIFHDDAYVKAINQVLSTFEKGHADVYCVIYYIAINLLTVPKRLQNTQKYILKFILYELLWKYSKSF